MKIRGLTSRMARWLSVVIVLPLALAMPMLLFANGNGGVDGDNNGNHYGQIKNGDKDNDNNQGNENNGNRGGHDGDDDNGGSSGPLVTSTDVPGGAPAAAPEINMATINSAMALLVGGAMWLRHRK